MSTFNVQNIENLIKETKRLALVRSDVKNAAAWIERDRRTWHGMIKIMAFEINKDNFDDQFMEDLGNALYGFAERLGEKVDVNTEKLNAIETLINN